ncbi:MAG TPA: hypothetical protein VFQ35_15960 [Polyangiaceae bacterium]|nr:hypothetical protein [Polyangiaceae bacterium]
MNDALSPSVRARALRAFFAAMALGCVAMVADPAAAKPEFPAELAKGANMGCVPQCTVCHTVNPGVAGTGLLKPFPKALVGYNLLGDGAEKAFEAMKAENKPEYQSMIQAIEDDHDPNYPLQLACGPAYGCGAHVAKKPPRNYWGAGWVLGVLSAYALARRLKSRAAQR